MQDATWVFWEVSWQESGQGGELGGPPSLGMGRASLWRATVTQRFSGVARQREFMHQSPVVPRSGESYTVPLSQVLPKSTSSSADEALSSVIK